MELSSRFTVAIAGATPEQPRGFVQRFGEAPVWPGIEVDSLVSRLAERALDHGWRLGFPLRSPFATLLLPLCRRRQSFRPHGDPAPIIWYRQPELGLIDPGNRPLSREEQDLNADYARGFFATL